MSDAPPPALGELARRAKAALDTAGARWYHAYELDGDTDYREHAEFMAACSPAVILQLVALATGGAEAKLREAMAAAADELENDPKTRTCYNVAATLREALALTPERPADAR